MDKWGQLPIFNKHGNQIDAINGDSYLYLTNLMTNGNSYLHLTNLITINR